MPPQSRQKRLEDLADGMIREIRDVWLHTCLPMEVRILSQLFARRCNRLGLGVLDVLRAMEGEGRLKLLRTPRGKGWVLERHSWKATSLAVQNSAVYRLDRLVELRKALNSSDTLGGERMDQIQAELARVGRFD